MLLSISSLDYLINTGDNETMAVLEVGAIADGIPIFILNPYRDKEWSQSNPNLQSALLYAIQGVTQGAYADQISQLIFGNIIICFDKSLIQKKNIILYTIVDKKTRIVKNVCQILKKLSREIEAKELKLSLMPTKNEAYFSPLFTNAFKLLFLNIKKRSQMLFN